MPLLARRVSPWFLLLLGLALVGGVLCAIATSRPVAVAGVFVLGLAGWAVSLCLHEFGHAFVAYRGGDTSVAMKGYLTLDFRRYTDVGYSFVLPLIILLIGALPLPGGAVWINQWALRSNAWRSAVSAAGPGANLVLGVVLTIVIGVVYPESVLQDPSTPLPVLAAGLSLLAYLQIIAFILNLLPVPGLDGWGVLEPYLSPSAQRFGARVRPWAPLALFLFILLVPGVGSAFFYGTQLLYGAVGGSAKAAGAGLDLLFFWR